MDNFDLKKYLVENKLTKNSKKFITTEAEQPTRQTDYSTNTQKALSVEDSYTKLQIGSVDGFNIYKIPQGAKKMFNVFCELGAGAEWCSTTNPYFKTPSQFDSYVEKDPIYLSINPETGEKYFFSYVHGEFKDKKGNNATNIDSLLKFLKEKEGKAVPFAYKLQQAPETLTPKDLNIEGFVDLSNTEVTYLPDNLQISGFLDLTNTKINILPKGLKVGGDLILANTRIIAIPNDLQVGGDLDLAETRVRMIPKGFKVGGDLDLADTKITALPTGLEVGGDLNLTDTKITTLPQDLQVDGSIRLYGGINIDPKTIPSHLLSKIRPQSLLDKITK
jgi:hypothetical protein